MVVPGRVVVILFVIGEGEVVDDIALECWILEENGVLGGLSQWVGLGYDARIARVIVVPKRLRMS